MRAFGWWDICVHGRACKRKQRKVPHPIRGLNAGSSCFAAHLKKFLSLFSHRCGMRSDCSHGLREGHWLWSFDMGQKCLKVESLTQSNISLGEQKHVCVCIKEKSIFLR